ncbi:RagB/SusD family nutrient uptake outer membrane protein [Larkinella insperata]|uniref:RagB/SusD family nutrient uptake outer membrane protein n=1 Tax=Larkinella insperata TaxID=332158 RepID=A0ABW3Q7W4_9BACT
MKRAYHKLLMAACLLSLVSFNACQDSYLDVEPKGNLNETALATKAGVNGLLIGAYSLLDGVGGPGTFFLTGVANAIVGSMAADDSHKGGTYGAQQDINLIENHSLDPSNGIINEKWRVYYAGIQRANDALRVLEKVPAGELTEQEITQIRAEAVFIRAVQHLEAAKMWRNIPYLDETVSFASNNYYVDNTTPVWPKIEADLNYAAGKLTPTKSEVGRANSWAAKAFLAKAYMFQRKFTEAKPLLKDLIDNGVTASGRKYALVALFANTWLASAKNSSESVFAVQSSVNDGAVGYNGNAGEALNTPTIRNGGTNQPSFSLVNSFKTDSITGLPLLETFNDTDMKHDLGLTVNEPFTPYAGTVDPRLDHTVGRRGIPYLDWGLHGRQWIIAQNEGGPFSAKKTWFNKADLAKYSELIDGWADATANNYTMIRFADVLLWAAEVEVEIGSLAEAERLVNLVRARAANREGWVKTYVDNNEPSKGFTNTPAANYKIGLYTGQFTAKGKEFARESVRFERKLELAMEGHRFFDLQRYDNGTGYMADVLNAYIKHETTTYDYQILKGARFIKGKHELYPIPLAQIDLSMQNGQATLKQNPNY